MVPIVMDQVGSQNPVLIKAEELNIAFVFFSPIFFQLRVLLNLNSGSVTGPSLLVGPDASNAVKSSSKTTTSTNGRNRCFIFVVANGKLLLRVLSLRGRISKNV